MELLTRNNFENWMQKVMERLDRQDEMLLSMQPSGKAPNPMDGIRLFDNQDLCILLQISKRTLQRYRDEGRIPFSLMGHTCRYRLTDVERMMNGCSMSGNTERIGELHRQYMVRIGKGRSIDKQT